jgi:hypothetical protein
VSDPRTHLGADRASDYVEVQQIRAILKSLELSELQLLYSLATLWRNGLYTPDYAPSDEWKSIAVLTGYGETTSPAPMRRRSYPTPVRSGG